MQIIVHQNNDILSKFRVIIFLIERKCAICFKFMVFLKCLKIAKYIYHVVLQFLNLILPPSPHPKPQAPNRKPTIPSTKYFYSI